MSSERAVSQPTVTLELVERMIPAPQPTFGPDWNMTECHCRQCQSSRQAKALVRAAARVVAAARLNWRHHDSVTAGCTTCKALAAFDAISQGKGEM